MSALRHKVFGWGNVYSDPRLDIASAIELVWTVEQVPHDELWLAVGAATLRMLALHPVLVEARNRHGSLTREQLAADLGIGFVRFDATLTTTAEVRGDSGVACVLDGICS